MYCLHDDITLELARIAREAMERIRAKHAAEQHGDEFVCILGQDCSCGDVDPHCVNARRA